MKKCITCKVVKLVNDFYSGKNECKQCKNKRSLLRYKENKNTLSSHDSLTCRQPEVIFKFLQSILIPENKNLCWIWLKGKARKGYGQFYIGSKALRAHRVSYLIFKGNIDNGLSVCHSCDNSSCVNPNHLWLGTNKDNVNDREKKNRNKTPFVKGHKKGGRPKSK